MKEECPLCGETAWVDRRGDFVFDLPPNFPVSRIVIEDAEWEECEACEEQLLRPVLQRRLEAERYRLLGLLLPEQIRAVRKRLGLTQVEMARFLSVGDKTYTRWESGRSLQSKSMDSLIRFADAHPELFEELHAERDPSRKELVKEYVAQLPTLKGENELAMAAHGELPGNETVHSIRRRLQEMLSSA